MIVVTTKLHELNETLSKNGAYLYVIVPDGLGGWLDCKINVNTLLAGSGSNSLMLTNVTGNQSQAILIDCFIWKITIKPISGTPNIKIGTTFGGTEITDTIDVTSPTLQITTEQFFTNAGFVYFEITGGYVNIRIDLINNYI